MRFAVDAHTDIALFLDVLENFLILPFTALDDGCQHLYLRLSRRLQHLVDDLLGALAGNFTAAAIAVRDADLREKQTEVIVNFRGRPDGGTGVGPGDTLFD